MDLLSGLPGLFMLSKELRKVASPYRSIDPPMVDLSGLSVDEMYVAWVRWPFSAVALSSIAVERLQEEPDDILYENVVWRWCARSPEVLSEKKSPYLVDFLTFKDHFGPLDPIKIISSVRSLRKVSRGRNIILYNERPCSVCGRIHDDLGSLITSQNSLHVIVEILNQPIRPSAAFVKPMEDLAKLPLAEPIIISNSTASSLLVKLVIGSELPEDFPRYSPFEMLLFSGKLGPYFACLNRTAVARILDVVDELPEIEAKWFVAKKLPMHEPESELEFGSERLTRIFNSLSESIGRPMHS